MEHHKLGFNTDMNTSVWYFPWLRNIYVCIYMRATLKLMPPTLLCWPMNSEVDVSGMVVEVEPSLQYFVIYCCHATDGSRVVVWQNGI